MGEILERSLTEMDWLLQLNGFSAAVDSSESSDSRGTSPGLGDTFIAGGPVSSHARQTSLLDCRGRNVKPPFSYTHLITLAISSTPRKRMALSEIYQWIKDNYPYYRTAAPGWKNSVRHNLSLNKNFVKVARRKDEPGKGAYWALENSVVKKLNSRHQSFVERVPLVSCENDLDDSFNSSKVEDETAFAVQTITHNQPSSGMYAFSPLDYSDEEEVHTIIDEVETVAGHVESASYGAGYHDLGPNLEWLRNSLNGKLDASWTAGIDLDFLMTSIKSENGKSLSFEHIADLMTSSAHGVHYATATDLSTVDRKFDPEELSPHDLHHFTELRPLFDAVADGTLTSSADFERYTSLHNDYDVTAQHLTQVAHSPYVLDHSSYTFQQQQPSLSLHRPYPQQTIAVVGRSKMAAVGALTTGSAHYGRHDNDDDIEDDFNWDNLIDKTDERPLASVATHC